MNLTFEAILAALLALGLLALALVPVPQPSYAGVAGELAAQDVLEVIEKDGVLLAAAYGLAYGEPAAVAQLSAFSAFAERELGLKCLSISSGGVALPQGCGEVERQVVLRRLLFDGKRFFFLQVTV